MSSSCNALCFLAAASFASAAVDLRPGVPFQASYAQGNTSLVFASSIAAGETMRIVVDQGSNDLAIVVRLPGGGTTRFDEFEFGPEKITLTSAVAGSVSLTVTPAQVPASGEFTILRENEPVESKPGEAEAAAQDLATRARAAMRQKTDRAGTRSLLTGASAMWAGIGDRQAVALTQLELGDTYSAESDWKNARPYYIAALSGCGGMLRCAAEAANNAALASLNAGEIEEADRLFPEAAEGWRKLGLPLLETRTLSNLGLLHYQTGEYAAALSDFGKARVLLAAEHPLLLATVLNNTGLIYLAEERYTDAEKIFGQAVDIAANGPDGEKVHGRILINLGRTYMLEAKLTLGLREEEKAFREAADSGDTAAEADALDNIGQIQLRAGDSAKAMDAFAQAFGRYQSIGSARGLSSVLFFRGTIHSKHGQYTEAESELKESLEIRLSRRLQSEAAETWFELALLERNRGDFAEAIGFAEKAASAAEKLRLEAGGGNARSTLFAKRRRYFEYLIGETLAHGDPKQALSEAFAFAERARARSLADMLDGSPPGMGSDASPSAERRALLRSIAFKSRHLAAIELRKNNEADVRRTRTEIETLLLRDEQLDVSVTSGLTHKASGLEPVGLANFQAELEPQSDVALEYWLGEQRSYVWVIRHDRVEVRELPARDLLERRVNELLQLLTDLNGRRAAASREALFQASLRRTARDVGLMFDDATPSRIIVIADSILNRVPFAALPVAVLYAGKTTEWKGPAGLSSRILQPPSATVFLALRHADAESPLARSVVAFGNPVFSADDARTVPIPGQEQDPKGGAIWLPPLPFSRIELQAVESLVPPSNRRVYRDFDASRDNFLGAVRQADGLVLISTHALTDDQQPDLSSIALSLVDRAGRPVDGLVHLYDLTRSEVRLRSALIVLSACEGAAGMAIDGEGLQSLARGFLLAGARGVIASAVVVDAEGTAYFVRSFLEAVIRHGQSPQDGLRTARRAMSGSIRWRDPYYWATFSVIGAD